MKNQRDIDDLLYKAFTNRCTKKEEQLLNDWINSSDKNALVYDYLKNIWKEKSVDPKFINTDELAELIWEKGVNDVGSPLHSTNKPNSKINFLVKIAAAIIILVVASMAVFHNYDLLQRQPEQTGSLKIITKSNPAGQKSKINLPDGSQLWLNAESSISYMDYFTDSSRTIKLQGEAYFDVKKDNNRPFKVITGSLTTTALGTTFNISAYPDTDHIKISLISGKIDVNNNIKNEHIILEPGYGACFHKETLEFKKKKCDLQKVLAWKDGILIFDGDDFSTFKHKLEKWYGVKIKVVGQPPVNWKMRGTFKNEYLSNILDVTSFNKEYKYTINRKEVILMFN